MSVDLPTWTAFDPEAPATLPALLPPPGKVVALVASPAATSAGWGPDLAVDLARAWSRSGGRVVLADLGLTRSALHEVLGGPDGEGVTDVVVFGASPRRVARPVEGESFFVVPAGTVVADAPTALASPRWGAVCTGFRDAGVLLALYVPADEPGRAAAFGMATDAVVLASPDEDASDLLAGTDVPVRAVLGPRPSAAPAGEGPLGGLADVEGEVGGQPPEAMAEPEEALAPVDAAASIGAAPLDREGLEDLEVAPEEDAAGPGAPGPVSRAAADARHSVGTLAQPRSSKRTLLLLVILVLLVLATLAAAWLGYVHIPGITPPSTTRIDLLPG